MKIKIPCIRCWEYKSKSEYKESFVECSDCLVDKPTKLESFTIVFLTLLMIFVIIAFMYAIYSINTMIWN